MRKYTFVLLAVCVVLFVIQAAFPVITDSFALYRDRVLAEPWLLVTSVFLHGGLDHLFFNMFALGLFGFILENIIGSKRFLFIYFVAGIAASLGAAIFYPASLGASGAIFGILGTLTVLRPRMKVWVLGVPMPMFVAAILWAGIDLIGMFAPGNTANAAHLFGLGAGLLAGYLLKGKFRLPKRSRDPLTREDRKRIEKYFDRLDEFAYK
ncbi:MAG: rhomboid family intramembrane serine protease [archaeon]|nr:MAG: rhomboid family intramembrane serine protease [archaeon]